jgi:hypothetical protein
MLERVIDASLAVKWVMKGESHRQQARKLRINFCEVFTRLQMKRNEYKVRNKNEKRKQENPVG